MFWSRTSGTARSWGIWKPKPSATRQRFWVERPPFGQWNAGSCTCRGQYWTRHWDIKACAVSDFLLQYHKRQREKKRQKYVFCMVEKPTSKTFSTPVAQSRSLDYVGRQLSSDYFGSSDKTQSTTVAALARFFAPFFHFSLTLKTPPQKKKQQRAQCVVVWTLMMIHS